MTELVVLGTRAVNFTALPGEDVIPSQRIHSLHFIPGELIQIIILYYTNSVEGLLHLRTINQEWKSHAESSILWLYCSLTFYCPKNYLLPLKNHSIWCNFELNELKEYLREDCGAFADDYQNVMTPVGLFQIFPNEKAIPPTCKVICDMEQNRKKITSLFYRTEKENRINNECESKSEESATVLSNRLEIAKEISHWFLFLFRQFNARWEKKAQKLVRLYACHNLLVKYFDCYLVPSGLFLTNVFFAIGLYGFTTLQSNILSGAFGPENHLAFACCYGMCFIYVVLTIGHIAKECLALYYASPSLEPKLVYLQSICGYDSVILCFLTVTAMLGMLHEKSIQLSRSAADASAAQANNNNNINGSNGDDDGGPSFSWTLTVTPIWVAVILATLLTGVELFFLKLSKERKSFMFRVLIVIYLAFGTVQLLASYYDKHFIASIGYALIPLFPVMVTLIVLSLSMIIYIGYYWLYQGLIFRLPLLKRLFLLVSGFLYTFSILGMGFAMILLVLESFLGYEILIPSLSPVGEFAALAFCINIWVTMHMTLASPKFRLEHETQQQLPTPQLLV